MSTTLSQAIIPQLVRQSSRRGLMDFSLIVGGVLLLSLLAQLTIPLPWTPIPITGQTFGVALISLSWGRTRAFAIVLTYIFLGSAGAPILAHGQSGLILGPSLGYLIGMIAASYFVGTIADRGQTKTFSQALGAAYVGSACTFFCGLIGLSFFIPTKQLFLAGFIPFIPGDLIKNLLAAYLTTRLGQQARVKNWL